MPTDNHDQQIERDSPRENSSTDASSQPGIPRRDLFRLAAAGAVLLASEGATSLAAAAAPKPPAPPKRKRPSKATIIYGPNCTATGATSIAYKGVPATVLVRAYNIYNQPINVGGGRFRAHIVGHGHVKTRWTDNGNGTYLLTYTCPKNGVYTLHIKHAGRDIMDSPFTVTVGTISVASDLSTATGELVTQGTVNTPFDVAVQARDAAGNNLTTGGDTVAVRVTSGPAGFTPFTVLMTDQGDGTYTGQTDGITQTGLYATTVTVNGHAVVGSPFAFASFLASDRSTVSVPATASLGGTVAVTIQGVTLAGTPVTAGEGTDLFNVIVTGPNNLPVLVTGVDNHNGTYTYSFTAEAAGTYVIDASIFGRPLVGSGATMVVDSVVSQVLTPSLCFADGVGLTSANQFYKAYFVVTTVDQHSNVFYEPGTVVAATATTASTQFPVEIIDQGNGLYNCYYLPLTVENVTLTITVNGVPILNSPYNNIFVLNSCYGPLCVMTNDLSDPTGIVNTFVFTMNDASGNPVLNFHDNFVAFSTNGYPLIPLAFSQAAPGLANFTFAGQIVGNCETSVQVVNDVNALDVNGSPFEQHRPDVTLMDLNLPGMSGLETIEAIRRKHPSARIVVLTMYKGDEDIHRALESGASAYVLKTTVSDDLVRVVREVHAGAKPMSSDVASQLAARAVSPPLTPRERVVVEMMAKGLRNKEIAYELGISEDTVEVHARNLFTKLGVRDRTAAVTAAIRRGIIHLPQ